MTRLFIVATPIGNLSDITLRALQILKEAEIIICEDTRTTRKLLAHFDIHTPMVSFHAHSGLSGMQKVVDLLGTYTRVALVSDAGTPGISDPGLELVSFVRQKLGNQVHIETIPGASALIAALSISGLRAHTFTFYGFLPLKKGRKKLFQQMAKSDHASVFYESPHRIERTLSLLVQYIKTPRRVGVFRELTKVYEEHIIGSAEEVLEIISHSPEKKRGEFVVILEGQ